MKTKTLTLTLVILMTMSFSGIKLSGQEKTATEKENELKLQQAIELQKKAMMEAKKAQDLQLKELENLRLDTIIGTSTGRSREGLNFYRSRQRNPGAYEGFNGSDIYMPDVNSYLPIFYGHGDAERTTWDYSKQVKESTYSKDLTFDVEKTAKSVNMAVNGDCKSGQIRVKIIMPGGKVYSDIVIDEFGNLNWRKSFSISDEQNKDKTGEWKFRIEAEKATGFFKISLQTY